MLKVSSSSKSSHSKSHLLFRLVVDSSGKEIAITACGQLLGYYGAQRTPVKIKIAEFAPVQGKRGIIYGLSCDTCYQVSKLLNNSADITEDIKLES